MKGDLVKTSCDNKKIKTIQGTMDAAENDHSVAIMETDTTLSAHDILGGWSARWGVNRMDYKVTPGLYKIGTPEETSSVLVTANYKLTFDHVRKELTGLNVWLLVLDTKGVNVWCAAGKGTFGTGELIHRIESVNLSSIVNHGIVILPQLGAPGIASHEIKKATGFRVVYGPVYAKNIRKFLDNGQKANAEMRKVQFGLGERLKVMSMNYLKNVTTLTLNVEKCIGCGLCTEVCPQGVFSINNKKARIDNKDSCMECGGCAKNCPTAAILVNAGVGCAGEVIYSFFSKKGSCFCGGSGR